MGSRILLLEMDFWALQRDRRNARCRKGIQHKGHLCRLFYPLSQVFQARSESQAGDLCGIVRDGRVLSRDTGSSAALWSRSSTIFEECPRILEVVSGHFGFENTDRKLLGIPAQM